MSRGERVQIVVRGRVQGVFYRASARDEGERLGLSGEVRNLPDGCVQLVAEGEREQLEKLIAWCRRGPPMAQVDDVEVTFCEADGQFRGFHVTR
jgi:acylphosphatase